jgi:hypothetical protein
MISQEFNSGFRWPVAVEQPIAAPANEVWQAISTPHNLERCHPFCAKNPVQVWSGPGSRDEVHYLNGLVFERQFHMWIEGVGYDLYISRRGGRLSYVSWRISPAGDRNCVLRIVVYPHVLQNVPAFIRWIPHVIRVRPMLKKYLKSVAGGFEWYSTHKKAVPRNKFGRHPWFSAPK